MIANEKKEKIIQIAGSFERIYPSTWDERMDVAVELKLGYGEQEQDSQKYLAYHQMMSQDPSIAPMYKAENKYNVIRAILDKNGIKNINEFITSPDQIEPPQPDPMMMKQLELEERKVAAQEALAKAQSAKVEANASMDAMRIELEKIKLELNQYKTERELERKEFDSTSRAAIAAEELSIAQNSPPESVKAIISPN